MLAPLTAACIAASAASFNLAEPLLWTILRTEGGRVGACVLQASGTHDCGPAQVNAETWVPRLARQLNRPQADVMQDLRDDGCFNMQVAAYILRIEIDGTGGNIWDGAGRYNSATPVFKHAYQARLVSSYMTMFSPHPQKSVASR